MRRFVLLSVITVVLLLSMGGLRALGRAAGTLTEASAGRCLDIYPTPGLGVTVCTP